MIRSPVSELNVHMTSSSLFRITKLFFVVVFVYVIFAYHFVTFFKKTLSTFRQIFVFSFFSSFSNFLFSRF